MKRKILILIDILTTILLIIQIQSTVSFILTRFSILQNYSWEKYLIYYTMYGVSDIIDKSPFSHIYIRFVSIVFLLNIYAIVVKMKGIFNKEFIKGIYRYFIIFNAVFVVLKIFELYFYLYTLTHA